MYDYANKDLFYVDGINKQYLISTLTETEEESVVLTNDDIDENNFELRQAIMTSNPITFQNCMSDYIKFVTHNTEAVLMNSPIAVFEILNYDTDNPIPIGIYTVKSDNMSIDGRSREIIAYDQMYDIIQADVTAWYNSLSFPISVKDYRDSFFSEFAIQQEDVALINDDIQLPRQFSENDEISGDTIIKGLAELNGTFIHITKRGTVDYIYLDRYNIYDETRYPGLTTFPGSKTFPGLGYTGVYQTMYKSYYKEDTIVWGNYTSAPADGIQIRNETGDIVYQTNEAAENPYTIINNYTCYYLTDAQYETIAKRLLTKLKALTYTPFEGEFMGNPCLEVGDRVLVKTRTDQEFLSYVFSKSTSGILVPFEKIQTPGSYYFGKYNINANKNKVAAKVRNLEQRTGNMEKAGSGALQIQSVTQLPANPQLNVLYLIQGEVEDVVNGGSSV